MTEVMEGEYVPADCPSEQSLYDTCVFSGGPSPGGEKGRYGQLENLGMLDTSPTKPFDRITKMMSTIFQTPVSLITLVADPTRVWFKSCVGPFGSCVDRDSSTVPDTKCFWFAMAFANSDEDISTYGGNSFGWTSEEHNSSETTSTWGAPNSLPASIRTSNCGSAFGEHSVPIDLGDIEMGPLLGSGGYGKVYRGVISGETAVAVKVIDYRNREAAPQEKFLAEINLQTGLDHPGIVKMISSGASYDEVDSTKINTVWMVQELCDMGNLTGAAEAGWLRQERQITANPAMNVIYPTMGDVAGGMAYLHEKNIIHADLTGRNVMLVRSERPHGFAAKVGDFGIARVTQAGVPLCTVTLGTITHMPPELLQDNLLYPAADVWAFGVIGWEAYYGKMAYAGKNAAQITLTVVRKRALPWPADAPEAFVSLMKKCMTYDLIGRPLFTDVVTTIAQTQIS